MSEFACAPTALMGPGCLAELPAKLERSGARHALVVTDRGLVAAGIVGRVVSVLEASGIETDIYDGVTPNPTLEEVEEGCALYCAQGCDALVAVGGGSANDCAKAIRARLSGMGELDDPKATKRMPRRGPVLVAVNTTAGTGSEVSRAYLISDTAAHRKLIFKDDYAMPDIAVDDCDLMMGLPPQLTAWTGMDALTHAIEALVSQRHFLMTDVLALDAIELIAEHLPRAVRDGSDVEARDAMACAQYLAGMSFGSAGLGLAHAMAHQFGALYDAPHGLANAVVLPEVMEFYLDTCADRLARVAAALDPSCTGLSEREAAEAAVSRVRSLLVELGVDAGRIVERYREGDLEVLSRQALEDGCLATSPRIPDARQVRELFEKTMASARALGSN